MSDLEVKVEDLEKIYIVVKFLEAKHDSVELHCPVTLYFYSSLIDTTVKL